MPRQHRRPQPNYGVDRYDNDDVPIRRSKSDEDDRPYRRGPYPQDHDPHYDDTRASTWSQGGHGRPGRRHFTGTRMDQEDLDRYGRDPRTYDQRNYYNSDETHFRPSYYPLKTSRHYEYGDEEFNDRYYREDDHIVDKEEYKTHDSYQTGGSRQGLRRGHHTSGHDYRREDLGYRDRDVRGYNKQHKGRY